MGLFKTESLDSELSTLARGVLVSFSLELLKFLGGGYYPTQNFIRFYYIQRFKMCHFPEASCYNDFLKNQI